MARNEKKQHKNLHPRLNTDLHEIKLHLNMVKSIEVAFGKMLEQFPDSAEKGCQGNQNKGIKDDDQTEIMPSRGGKPCCLQHECLC
jgi:hypothetical protein